MSSNVQHRAYITNVPAATDGFPYSWQGLPTTALFIPLYRLGSGVVLAGGTARYLLTSSGATVYFYLRSGTLWQQQRSWTNESSSNFCCLKNAVIRCKTVTDGVALEILRDDGSTAQIDGPFGPAMLGENLIVPANGTNTFAVSSGNVWGSDYEIAVYDAATCTCLRRLTSSVVGSRGSLRAGDGCLVAGYDRSVIVTPEGDVAATVMNKRAYALLTSRYLVDAAGVVYKRENSGFTATGGTVPGSGVRYALSIFENFCGSYRLKPEGAPVQEPLELPISMPLPDRRSPVVWFSGTAYANVPVLNDASIAADPQLAYHLNRGGLSL